MTQRNLSPGDKWPEHYRGYRLHVNQQGDVWWQVYNGTDRLYIDSFPDGLIDALLEHRPIGGRIHITEAGDVLTKLEEDEDNEGHPQNSGYTGVWIGSIDLTGELTPKDDPDYAVPIRPKGQTAGDLWPSVYDGARYSFGAKGRIWWRNRKTKRNYPVTSGLPDGIWQKLKRHKPLGGSFRVTPGGDVITLIEDPAPDFVQKQFGELPPLIRNIIKLRRDRGDLAMLPIYIGTLNDPSFTVKEPPSLTDSLSPDDEAELESWAASLGSTNQTGPSRHRARSPNSSTEASSTTEATRLEDRSEAEAAGNNEEPPNIDDDPVAWLEEDLKKTEERINDRFD